MNLKDYPIIIVALDFPTEFEAMALVDKLDPKDCAVKVGKELHTACGSSIVNKLVMRGFRVFLDLKFHDIPNTVAGACRVAADQGVWMMNVHAGGGPKMLTAAAHSLEPFGATRPLLIAVTVLTSMDDDSLRAVGIQNPVKDQVKLLAKLSENCGFDGVVCSGLETAMLRQEHKPDFGLVVPGIRHPNAPADDQRRTVTPEEAIMTGASHLVIGRPITQASDPSTALKMFIQCARDARAKLN